MIKRVMIFRLKEGTDPEEFWKYWEQRHAAEYKELPGLSEYVINRVTKVVRTVGQDLSHWGLVETWWESEEAYDKAQAYEKPDEYFVSCLGDRFGAWVEEKKIK
jgi:uncharacterized protein (TIGR02118 family)